MKTNKKLLIYVSTIIILTSFIIPTAIWLEATSHDIKISGTQLTEFATLQTLILSFWGLVINIILVMIAYKAFRNFGVKEQYHNKQLSLVTDLATDISSTILSNMMYRMIADPKGDEHRIADGYTLSFFEISLGFNYSKFDLMCVRTNNIENTFPFLKHRNNPVLPPSIAKKLNKLYRPLQYTGIIEKSNIPKNWIMLEPVVKNKDDYSYTWLYKFYDNPTDFTKDCLELRLSIINWFKDYGADDVNI